MTIIGIKLQANAGCDETTLRLHHGQPKERDALHRRDLEPAPRRAFEHREGLIDGFTRKYNCKLIVWYEIHETMEAALIREKQIKAGSRKNKIRLIQSLNPEWGDLYDSLI